jgi:hypothetical protein
MNSLIRNLCIFETVTDTINTKQLENGEETHQVLVGDISREWRYKHSQMKMVSQVPKARIG